MIVFKKTISFDAKSKLQSSWDRMVRNPDVRNAIDKFNTGRRKRKVDDTRVVIAKERRDDEKEGRIA